MTMPHFEIRGAKNNKLSKALQLSFVPLIPVEHREGWEAYVKENGDWLAESLTFQEEFKIDENDFRRQRRVASETQPAALEIPSQIWRYQDGESGEAVPQTGLGVDFGPGAYAPIWQQSPAPSDPSIINFDLLSHPVFKRVYHGMWETRLPVLSEAMDLTFIYGAAVKDDAEHPHSFLLSPIYTHFSAKLHDRDDLAGFLVAIMAWDTYFTNLLVEGTNGIVVVLEDTCDDHFTYQINGPEAVFMGEGDLHDTKYDDFEFYTDFAPFLQHNFSDTHEHCEYFLRIFPSAQLEAKYRTSNPGIYTAVVLAVFLVTALAFIMYDRLVQARQNKVMATAKRTNAIVSSLFPSNVRDRMMQEIAEEVENEVNAKGSMFGKIHNKTKLKAFLEDENDADHTPKAFDSKPVSTEK